MKTLYISDLDGTLFGSDSRISKETESILTQLPSEKLFTIATARTPATVDLILPRTVGPHIPSIVITGAALWHRDEHRYSDVKIMDPQAALKAEEVMLKCSLAPFTYTIDAPGGMLYTYGRIPAGRPRFAPLTTAERNFVDERRNLPLKKILIGKNPGIHPSLLIFGIGTMKQVTESADRIKNEIDCSISVYGDVFNPEKGFVEVFAPGVSKGSAALDLKKRIGADRLVVFGDSHNDIAMLSVADTAVVVANANDEVKKNATVITGPNTESSVARFIAGDSPEGR
ncbi:MAG: HAD family phosphatase [Bacteroides sp.]|nr:HAD family phosphatase [Bacteroides sp.]